MTALSASFNDYLENVKYLIITYIDFIKDIFSRINIVKTIDDTVVLGMNFSTNRAISFIGSSFNSSISVPLRGMVGFLLIVLVCGVEREEYREAIITSSHNSYEGARTFVTEVLSSQENI